MSCGEPWTRSAGGSKEGKKYEHYMVGEIVSVDKIPKQAKLSKVMVQLGAEKDGEDEKEPIPVVTNAKPSHLVVGARVIVACVGAVVPAGADPEDDETLVVKKTAVGGVPSHGMLADSPMLGWKGGAAGIVVRLDPAKFSPGDGPPKERPPTYKG